VVDVWFGERFRLDLDALAKMAPHLGHSRRPLTTVGAETLTLNNDEIDLAMGRDNAGTLRAMLLAAGQKVRTG
jgi:hypothetical protein